MGWNLKIELTIAAIKALWSLVLGLKRLLILLLNNVSVKDCSMKRQYCLLYLKLLALIFLCKLNKGTVGSPTGCGYSRKALRFGSGLCYCDKWQR